MTGSFAVADAAGVQTFRYRQSSLTGAVLPCEFGGCMQAFANASAFLTPDQGVTGAGAFQRKSPVGGAANGMPLKIEMPSPATPLTMPPVTFACVMSAYAAWTGRRVRSTRAITRMISLTFSCRQEPSGAGV